MTGKIGGGVAARCPDERRGAAIREGRPRCPPNRRCRQLSAASAENARHARDVQRERTAGTRCCAAASARAGQCHRGLAARQEHHGARRRARSARAISRAMAAWTRPTSRASPSMASDRIAAGRPMVRARPRPPRASGGPRRSPRTSLRAKTGAAGSGEAPLPALRSSCAPVPAGRSTPGPASRSASAARFGPRHRRSQSDLRGVVAWARRTLTRVTNAGGVRHGRERPALYLPLASARMRFH